MRRWPLIRTFSFFVLCLSVFSAQPAPGNWLLDNAPESYLVQEGDTLWDIACKFLYEPGRWEEIWQVNPDIEDPNLIFPGDSIVLGEDKDKPTLQVIRGHYTSTMNKQTGVITLRPRVRELPAERAIPTIPMHIIRPFFNESRVVSKEQADDSARVIALDEDHILVSTSDLFYVRGLENQNVDDIYIVFKPTKTYFHPITNERLGIEGRILAKAQIDRPGKTTRFIVRQSYEEVNIGDRVTEICHEAVVSPFFSLKLPQGEACGYIISVFGGLAQFGQYQILTITGGVDMARKPGDVLAIYQVNKDLPMRFKANNAILPCFPPLKVGTCVVFRVFDKVSYVLVMSAIRAIYLLDEVGRP